MNPTLGLILGILAAVGGGSGLVALLYVLPTYRKLNAEARKSGAEASEVVARSASILLLPLQNEILNLQGQVTTARQQAAALEVALAEERRTSQEERLVSQQTINGLRVEIAKKDRRILEFELHLRNCQVKIGESSESI